MIRRHTSANVSKPFLNFQEFIRHMSTLLIGQCDCDGRGCVICISADALTEAADRLDHDPTN
jgi:hypothetical protein